MFVQWRLLAALALLALLVGGVVYLLNRGHERGVAEEQTKGLEKAVKNVEVVRDVENNFPTDANGKYAQCLRTSGGSENCKRYLPVVQTN